MDYNKLIYDTISPLVNNPKSIRIEIEKNGKNQLIKIEVDKKDISKVIGFKGNIINAIREVVGIGGKIEKIHNRIDIRELKESD